MKKLILPLSAILIVGILLFGFGFQNEDPNDVVTEWDLAHPTNTLDYANQTGSKILYSNVDMMALLADSGQLITHPNQGFGGAHASAIFTGGTIYGFGSNYTQGYGVGDDFTVPAGVKWQIDSIRFFSYQTGSTTTSTITGSRLAIYTNNTFTTLVAGDTTTSRLKSTYFTGIYRVTGTDLTNSQRPIMAVTDTLSVTLMPGNYWFYTAFIGSLTSGPWAPPRSILNQQVTGNGKQKQPTGWVDLLDGTYPQGVPFVVYGTAIPLTPPSWTEQTSPVTTSLYSVSAVNDNVAWACGASGKVLRTTNSGLNWVDRSGNIPAAYPLYNIFAWDENIALVTGSPAAGNYIYRTTNGGLNWTEVFNQPGGFGNALWMTDANTAYHMGDPVGGNWTLKKSTNGGVNWFDWATVPTTAAGWNNSFMMLGNNVWFGTNTNNIMYSSNLGVNWTTQTTTFVNQYAIWFNSATVGLAAYNALNVTTNGGQNWSALTSPLAASCGGITGAGSEWWVAPQATAIYYSSNNGANWTTQYTAPDGAWYHITKARNGSVIWGVRSNGKIARYGPPPVGVKPISSNVPENYSLSQNYPNPFNPSTKINFAIPKAGLVTLKVYDILGKEVMTLVYQNMNAGTYTVEFNGANLTSGVYFYKLDVNGFSEVKKMMLVK
ncbi:MAG: T9SS type A sorting domain-containing protein [Ignavibacteria bacterium]|nr:T9SS type A sorting domain-containing protein [Ignavibacteria bacterium]